MDLKKIPVEKIDKILEEQAKDRQITSEFSRISSAFELLKEMDIDEIAESVRINYEHTSGYIIINTYCFNAGVLDIFNLSKILNLADTFSIDILNDDTMDISFGFNYVFSLESYYEQDVTVEYVDNGEIREESIAAFSKTQAIRKLQRKLCSSIKQDNFKIK